MTQTAHTPGPWKFIDATQVAAMQYAPKCVIRAGTKQLAAFSWNDKSPHFPTKYEAQANARLIAAAPDMLEALIEAKSELRDYGPDHPSMRQIDTAIARATGEKEPGQ